MLPKKFFHRSALIQELSCVWDTDITSRLFSPSPSHSRWSMVEVREKVQIRVLVAGMFVIMQQSGEFEQIWTSNFMEVVLSNRSHWKPIASAIPSTWRWRSKWPSPSVLICICPTGYPAAFVQELIEIEVQSDKKINLANDYKETWNWWMDWMLSRMIFMLHMFLNSYWR